MAQDNGIVSVNPFAKVEIMTVSKRLLLFGLISILMPACSRQPDKVSELPNTKSAEKKLLAQGDPAPLEARIAELESRIRTLEARLTDVPKPPPPPREAMDQEPTRPAEYETQPIDDGLHTRNRTGPPQGPGNQDKPNRSAKTRPEFPDIGGNYFKDGKRLPEMECKIIQVDARLTVINEKKEAAPAHFDVGLSHILVPGWNLRGDIVGSEIYWTTGLDADSGKPDHRWVP
jgi:hypothetical protein